MNIQVLIENTGPASLRTEHGLSLYIQTEGGAILFDMGQTSAFAENAQALGADISAVDAAVLSHGHYDHGGGLDAFLVLNARAPVYLSPAAFAPHFAQDGRDIGIRPPAKGLSRLRYPVEGEEILPGARLYTCNERNRPYVYDAAGMYTLTQGRPASDNFCHEQYLLLQEGGKRVLISGCSHKGILNIMAWFHPDILVGGFHFMHLDPAGAGREPLEEAARILGQYPTRYYTCHCTGAGPYAFLKARLGHKLEYLTTGQALRL